MNLTRQTLQKMSRDRNVLRAVENVLMAQAYRETVEEIVKPQQKEVLQKHQFKIADEWTDKGREPGILTNPNHLELISDEDFKIYEKEMHEFYLNEGFNVKYGYCPLLMAENIERDAIKAMIDVFEPYTGISHFGLLCAGLDKFNYFVNITLRFFAPYVDKEKLIKEYC